MRIIESIDALAALVGEEIATSDWTTISQSRIQAFAAATGDHQWIHVDAERAARESPFRNTIAHGYLVLSMLPALIESCLRVEGIGMALNYGLDRVRFTAPVPAGSRIRARIALEQLTPCEGGVQARLVATFDIEGQGKPACVAQQLVRYYPRPDPH